MKRIVLCIFKRFFIAFNPADSQINDLVKYLSTFFYIKAFLMLPLFIRTDFFFLLGVAFLFGCSDPFSKKNGKNDSNEAFQPKNVIINEVMIRQEHTLADPDFGRFSGWLELHNKEERHVDLSGWTLRIQPLPDSESTEQSVQEIPHAVLPQGTTLSAGDYLLLWADGHDHTGQARHLPFTLPEEGGKILLTGPEAANHPVIDSLTYESSDVADDISLGRINFAGHNHRGFLLPMNHPTPGKPNRLARLTLLDAIPLNISDPSGLGLDHTENYLWVVSDNPGGSIYKITFQGEIVKELPVDGQDMESITQHPGNQLLYVAEERKREIVQFDTNGNEIQRFSVDVEMQRENDGLEGITINPSNNHVFVVNKRLPRVLIELDLSKGFDRQEIRQTPVNFDADKAAGGWSLAGLSFDSRDEVLWSVSDEARAVVILDTRGRPLAAFDADQYDLEGIALHRNENKIFLVSDELNTLYVYEYPDPLLRLPAPE